MDRVDSLLRAMGPGVQDVIALHTMTIIEEAMEGDMSTKVWQALQLDVGALGFFQSLLSTLRYCNH